MFSFFKKPELPKVISETPKPPEPPEPDYIIMVNGFGKYTINAKTYYGAWRNHWNLEFPSRELAEKYLLDYLEYEEKSKKRVVSEIFVKKG